MNDLRSASVTDTGRRRRHNEDAFVNEPPLFAVADGMGGAQAGELASGLAAAALRDEASGRIVNASTSTSGSVPSARVITERCGWDSASSGESRPLRTSSPTSEWSSVSCSSSPPRTR